MVWLCALLEAMAGATGLPEACVRINNGAPTLAINGTPHPGSSYMTYHPDGANFRKMGEAGVHLYSFSATPTESTYNLAKPCWVAPNEYDYTEMDARAHLVLDNDPDAYMFPRLFLGTPPWWADAHPEDLVHYDPGNGESEVFVLRGKRVASWASERWRADTADALRRFIQHVESSDYGSRVVGYHVASGTTEEWMQWGSNEDQWTDYSPVNVAAFRQWLRRKYGTDEALRVAWNDTDVSLDTATVPSRATRAASELGYLRDPAKAQAVIDYILYTSWLTADTVKYFARVVKDATHGKRLVGTFYGYILQLAGAQRAQNAGHLALDEILNCPDIDFVTSPSSYMFRTLGTGFPHAMAPVDAIKHHGKLWFDENDYRTWLTPNVEIGKFGKTATYEETLLSQQREFAWTLTNRLGMWWFDMGGGWYDDPRLLADIGKMARIARDTMGANGESVAEIAFVVSDKASAYLRPGNPFGWPAMVLQLAELGHIGTPFDTVYLGDLASLRPYIMYVFANCLAPTAADRALIEGRILAGQAAVVWVGSAGVYQSGAIDPEGMRQLTGMGLRLENTDAAYRVAPSDYAADWGWHQPVAFGENRPAEIIPVIEDGNCLILGALQGTDLPALGAQTRPNGGLTVFSGVPCLPRSLLRAIARKAGVHCYVEMEDIVWASRDLLAISVQEGGTRHVALPAPRNAIDLWTDETIMEDGTSCAIDIPDGGTALLRLE